MQHEILNLQKLFDIVQPRVPVDGAPGVNRQRISHMEITWVHLVKLQ